MTREYIIKVDDTKTDIMGGTPLEEPPKELVRCKDCMFLEPMIFLAKQRCRLLCRAVADDWFCANGKHKDGD